MAQRLSTSPRQLQRAFAENTGTSFSEHLVKLRMQKAARLLRKTQNDVAEVASEVGYGARGQFSRAFSRFYGVTPGRYRQAGTERIVEEDQSAERAADSAQRASLLPAPHLDLQYG